MTAGATFHSLTIDQVPRIMSVMCDAFDKDYSEAWSLEQVQGALAFPRTALIACESCGDIMGFALVRTVFDEAELLLIAVQHERRGAGFGQRLVNEAMKVARTDGAKRLFLEVRVNNRAIEFYQRMKFRVIGHRYNYYRYADGSYADAQTMVVDIT